MEGAAHCALLEARGSSTPRYRGSFPKDGVHCCSMGLRREEIYAIALAEWKTRKSKQVQEYERPRDPELSERSLQTNIFLGFVNRIRAKERAYRAYVLST